MPKRPAVEKEEKEIKDKSESEDEALGDLYLDRSDDEAESDDEDSSEYSELDDGEDDDDSGEEEDEEEGNAQEGSDGSDEASGSEDETEEIDPKDAPKDEGTDAKNTNDVAKTGEMSAEKLAKKTEKRRLRSLRKERDVAIEEGRAEKPDEYAHDSSDEEDLRNTIGNVPVNWYDEYSHIGYDLDGKQIRKPKKADELDQFLDKMENPEWGVTVDDPQTGQSVVLSEKDGNILKRLEAGKVPDPEYDLYKPWTDFYSNTVMETPLINTMRSKKSFLPSLHEKYKVTELMKKIKSGQIKPRKIKSTEEEEDSKRFYMLWETDDKQEGSMRRISNPIPAPKMRLPGHEESYNPPPEYLFTENERKQWERAKEDGEWKKLPFIPQKYSCLRKVPAYRDFIRDRFDRCMDLYLAPRARRMRLTIKPEDLVPQLPRPQDLQPFPTVCSITFKGHKNMVRCITMEPKGQYFMSASDDGTCKIWEIQSGRCLKTLELGEVVKSVAWCPNQALSIVAVTLENKVLLINTGVGDKVIVDRTNELLSEEPDNIGYVPPVKLAQAVKWDNKDLKAYPKGTLVCVSHFKTLSKVTWHAKGDYFATLVPDGDNRSVIIHQLSKWRSQLPFTKSKGLVQSVLFHPIRPYLFVATQKNIRVYDLVKQVLAKKLQSYTKWISSMAIHPGGDNLIVGTYDKKVQWFDMDLSVLPYRNLRYHMDAVRSVDFHKRYPLFASAGDDNNITVSHGMVYSDLLQNPLIVPVKKLSGHTSYDNFGVQCLNWHPTQPWLLSSGADGYIKLWT